MNNQRIGVKKMTLKEKLENCLKEAVDHDEAAGLSVLVRQGGEDLCYVSAGKADIASCRPVERDSIFRLYSQSKPITAAAAMILTDQGILDMPAQNQRVILSFQRGAGAKRNSPGDVRGPEQVLPAGVHKIQPAPIQKL